ncbi:MAG: DUF2196 domain-containing protein [Halodesulfurarchaeum sp.]
MVPFPEPRAIETGMTVTVEQDDTGDRLVGTVGAVLGSADPRGTKVKLASGVVGRVVRIGSE